MEIGISREYRDSLAPFEKGGLEALGLPVEIIGFLTETGLPASDGLEITPNAQITFLKRPVIKRYPYLRHDYLQIASLGVMGELAVSLKFQSVQQIQVTDDCGYELSVIYFVNDSLRQFVDCLGLWLDFYPQLRAEVGRQLEADPAFSLFDHGELYKPVLERLKEVDRRAVRERKCFWRRMCEPDIV